jgi:outer membrane protein assembly factor BamB
MERPNRRQFLGAATASSFALVGGCVGTPAARTGAGSEGGTVSDWPSFRRDRTNTGLATDVSPTSSDPSVEWTYDTEGPIWGSPIVVEDTVYIASADNSVYAIDAGSGEERWAFPTEHRVEATPAYADGTVYVGSYDAHLYAIDAATGDRQWDRALGGLIRGSPTVHDGAVYVGAGCYNLACSWYAEDADVPRNGWVFSLDAATGETIWRYEVGDEVVSTPAVDGDTVYVGASDDLMYALDVATREPLWTYDAGDMIWSSPAVAFETVYFGDWAGIVHAVDAASGEEVWTADTFGEYISGSVAVDDEAVYVGDTPLNTLDDPTTYYGEVFSFDRTSGQERWRYETDALEIGSSPVLTEDRLYVGAHSQRPDHEGTGVYAITTDGEEEWFLDVGARGVGSSPALVEGTLYFGGTDHRVYAVG